MLHNNRYLNESRFDYFLLKVESILSQKLYAIKCCLNGCLVAHTHTHLPHIHIYAYYKHSVCRWHPSSHMLGYISMIMVTMLMIRAIYFKWVIISGRLYLVIVMRALTDILPCGNRWWWWATEVCYCSALSILSLCLSTSSSLHLFVLWFNLRITSQEQSSAAIPPHDGVSRNTKRRQWKCISYTKSVLCFYWIMKNLW